MPIAAGDISWPGAAEAVPIVLALLAYAALYLVGVRRLRGTSRAVPGWRIACFAGGMLVLLAALASPIAGAADEVFWAHMVEHLMIGDFAALLLVLGLTGPLLAPVLRLPGMGALRVLLHPVVAFTLWALNLYAWHLPLLHEGAVRHDDVHALQHVLFLAFGMNMWMALLGPLPKPAWFGNAARLVYIIAVRLTAGVLGNVFVFGGGALYDVYEPGERAWNISPGGDQVAAGGIMMVEGSLITIGLFCWLFLRAARQTDERQDLIEFAAEHGVELDEKRAGRAVAAGRGEELRARIESDQTAPSARPVSVPPAGRT